MRRGSHWADWVGIIGRVTSSSLQIIILQSSSSNLENSFPQFSVVRSIHDQSSHTCRLELLARAIEGAVRQSTRAQRG